MSELAFSARKLEYQRKITIVLNLITLKALDIAHTNGMMNAC